MPRLSDIISTISTTTGRPESVIAFKAKSANFRPLIPGKPGPTPNSPAVYDDRDLFLVSLLLHCADAGFTTPELHKFVATLNDLPTAFAGGPSYAEDNTALDAIIRGAEVGDDWEIVVLVKPAALPGREITVHVTWAGWLDDPTSYAIQLRGELGTFRIPASKLLRPLLSAEG